MPLNLDIATIYIMDAFRANFIIMAELNKAIATNSTIADFATQSFYYIFGLIHWLSYALNDLMQLINAEMSAGNATWIRLNVGYWQKVALNATYVFGDWSGNNGLAYVWKNGYRCIQPGQYCFNVGYGNLTTFDALEMVKWQFNAMSEIGKRLSSFYP